MKTLSAILSLLFSACSITVYQAGDHHFSRLSLGVNGSVQNLAVVVLPNGARMLVLCNLNQNQSESAKAIAEGVAAVASKLVVP